MGTCLLAYVIRLHEILVITNCELEVNIVRSRSSDVILRWTDSNARFSRHTYPERIGVRFWKSQIGSHILHTRHGSTEGRCGTENLELTTHL